MKKTGIQIAWSVAYTLMGGLVFILGLNYLNLIPLEYRDAYKIGLPIIFLLIYLVARRYFPEQASVFLAYFLVSTGWTLDFYLTGELRVRFGLNTGELSGVALVMIISTVLVSAPVILGWLLSGRKLLDIFLKGRGRSWATITGLAGLLLFGGWGVSGAVGQGLAGKPLLLAIGWALVFSLSNSLREELTYRAAFLKGFQENIGSLATITVTTLVFALAHVNVAYLPPDQIIFAVVLVLIGVTGSLIMLKTGSLIGAVLFHAGADVLLVMSLLGSQQLMLR